jgi:hypothetical protein
MGEAERWSWRWWFDGDQHPSVWSKLLTVVIAAVGIFGVVASRGGQALPLAVTASCLGQVFMQGFIGVTTLDGQLRRRGPLPDEPLPRWKRALLADPNGARTSRLIRQMDTPVPRRPRSWYRALLAVAVIWIAVELVIAVAIARIAERGLWWYLGLAAAALMVFFGSLSALAAWRVQRAQAGPDPEPGTA